MARRASFLLCTALAACALFGFAGLTVAYAAPVVVQDDLGHYRAEIDADALAPLNGDLATPDGATAYAAPAKVVRLSDGAVFATTYLVLDTQCRRGSGQLVWLTSDGEVAGVQPWATGADAWPTRVAAVLCARIPGA